MESRPVRSWAVRSSGGVAGAEADEGESGASAGEDRECCGGGEEVEHHEKGAAGGVWQGLGSGVTRQAPSLWPVRRCSPRQRPRPRRGTRASSRQLPQGSTSIPSLLIASVHSTEHARAH